MWHSRRARRPVDQAEEVERRSRAFIEELDLPAVDNVLGLLPFMEQTTGREIQLVPFTPDLSDPDSLDPSAPCGMWIVTDTTDYLFYDEGVSPAYTEIVAGHEFAHMLKHRKTKKSLDLSGLGNVFTDIDPATVRLVLGRTEYTQPDEFEAELIGSLLQEHVQRSRAAAARGSDDDPIARTLLR
ncbi:hypothetical protein OG883_44335 [Streptomyces sp. NBC_01142]|uniref:hypothetical protein n=1 Tax=Streptomyces sp. NBC_01142 TaxID=2975865 RepID=UPI0022534E1A|nr:hypothetical protein [Streptomyces sp. NBC_01142]MCX4826673.1 hypothetical protein [Streptomyces sp. NBC_01142]